MGQNETTFSPKKLLTDTRGIPKIKKGLINRESDSWSQINSINNNALQFSGRPPLGKLSVFHESAVIS